MNIFKSYTYRWWEIGIFKISLLSIGILAGAYWSDFFGGYAEVLFFIATIATLYSIYISLKQI